MMAAQTELTTSRLPGAGATALPRQAAAAPQGNRLLFVDNLRILLISMVLVVHLDDTYGAIGSWDYHDPATNLLTGTLLSIPNAIGMASGMGFFFLLAGYFTPGSYDRKRPRSFLRDRLVRLGIPLLLFLFDLLYAAWRGLTRHRTQTTARTWKLPSYRAIFGFIFALGLVTFVVRIWWPAGWIFLPLNVPVGYLPQYLSLYILGLIAYRRNWFFEFTPKMGRDWSLIALMATLIIFGGLVFPSVMMQEAEAAGTRQAGFAYAFHVVALYPLLKWGIAVLITIPLCFLISLLIRKIPLANRVV